MEESFNKKRIALILLAVIIGIGAFWFMRREPQAFANGFEGNLVKAETGVLKVKGIYTKDGSPTGAVEQKEMTVIVAEGTIISREMFNIPTTTGMFVVDDLPKTITDITFGEMMEDAKDQTLGLIIKASGPKNIYGKKKFTAGEIRYRLPKISR